MIAGALWRDPERVADWAGELPRASRVLAYCGHGRESSQGVAKALAERGIGVQYLQGRAGRGAHVESCRLPLAERTSARA